MSLSYKSVVILLALSSAAQSFTPAQVSPSFVPVSNGPRASSSNSRLNSVSPPTVEEKQFFFADLETEGDQVEPLERTAASSLSDEKEFSTEAPAKSTSVTRTQQKTKKAKKAAGTTHKEGIFSPVVLAAKKIMGDKTLNKVRGKGISMHSAVITGFVEKSPDSEVGQAAMAQLFAIADKDGNGTIDKEELAAAMDKLGFVWIKEKQIDGIFRRADLDNNGTIDLDEFMQEAPRTLKTNLIKLAKKNGGELGFLV